MKINPKLLGYWASRLRLIQLKADIKFAHRVADEMIAEIRRDAIDRQERKEKREPKNGT